MSSNYQDSIHLEQFDYELVETHLLELFNHWRDSLGLKPFVYDPILSEASFDQVSYCAKVGKTEIEQPSSKKATTQKRVFYTGGLHGSVRENVQGIGLADRQKVPGTKERMNVQTYQEFITYYGASIVSDKESFSLLDKKFEHLGFALFPDKENNAIHISVIAGTLPYSPPKEIKLNRKSYGLKSYNDKACKKLISKYSYLKELFSSGLYIENNWIWFYYHDLGFFKDMFEDGGSLAVDLVNRSQFACAEGNRYHPSEVHDGVLLKPVSKSKILARNKKKEKSELEVPLMRFPARLKADSVELNLLVIQDKSVCETVYPNNIVGKELKNVQLNWMIDSIHFEGGTDAIVQQLEFEVPFERNKSEYKLEDIKPLLDSLKLNLFKIKEINLIAYSSLDGSVEKNKILQQKRAESILSTIEEYLSSSVKKHIQTEENWGGFFKSIKGSPYEIMFKGLSKDDIRSAINSDTLQADMEIYLEDQRKAKVEVVLETILKDSLLTNRLLERFELAVFNHEYDQALAIQTIMYQEVFKGNFEVWKLFSTKISNHKGMLSLLSNRLAFKRRLLEIENRDSLNLELKKELEILSLIDPQNPFVMHNLRAVELDLWAEQYGRVTEPRDLLKDIKSLSALDVPTWQINQLILSFNIIAADYYYEYRNYKERDKALKEVKKILLRAQLDELQTYEVANYFIMQLRLDWVIEIMLPWVREDNVEEDFLFKFLTVAIYEEEKVKPSEYVKFLSKASKLNPARFCELFEKGQMNIQMLKDMDIKTLYCETCQQKQ